MKQELGFTAGEREIELAVVDDGHIRGVILWQPCGNVIFQVDVRLDGQHRLHLVQQLEDVRLCSRQRVLL